MPSTVTFNLGGQSAAVNILASLASGGNPLPLPSSYVMANPSNYVNVINNNPGGNVVLEAGVYPMNQLAPSCNLYGADPTGAAVILEGGMVREYAMQPASGITIARMTLQGYLGQGSSPGYAPILGDGVSGLRLDTLITRRNLKSGLRIGTGWNITNWTSTENGQYGASGTGQNATVRNFVWNNNGIDGIPGVTRHSSTDRGGCKFVGSSCNILLEDGEVYGHDQKGVWWDGGANMSFIARRVNSHDNRQHGFVIEIAGSGLKIIEDCIATNNAQATPSERWRHAQIFVHTCANVTIRNNIIGGGRNGIILWQLASRVGSDHPGYAIPVEDCLVEGNAFTDGIAEIVTGIVGSSADGVDPYSAAANNRWVNNSYAQTGDYAWNGSTTLTSSQWSALGHS